MLTGVCRPSGGSLWLSDSIGPRVSSKPPGSGNATRIGPTRKWRRRSLAFSPMPEPELSLLFIRPLNQIGARYIVSGSIAAIIYGEPRLTHDVDFIIYLNPENVRRLPEVFPQSDFYLPPVQVILDEVARDQRGHFNVIHLDTGFKADFYTSGRDELHAWAFRNARRLEYRGEILSVAPPEYVIIRKLEYFREGGSDKHLRDIRSMLMVSGPQINKEEIQDWIKRRGLEAQWGKVQAA